jgi:serine/threonine protein kinase
VHPISEDHGDTYGWGLNRFVTEARTLAKFRHPNVVRVMSVFEANSTAYMVMEYERGESLEKLLKAKKITGEAKLRSLVMPLLDGLKVVHEAGFIHRDIKPDNIYLRENGTPVLLDFGSARQAIGVATRTLTALVTPGYAPFEQYDTSTAGEKKQGPWTDIYSMGATLYRAVTGNGPPDAMARVNGVMGGTDILKPASESASIRRLLPGVLERHRLGPGIPSGEPAAIGGRVAQGTRGPRYPPRPDPDSDGHHGLRPRSTHRGAHRGDGSRHRVRPCAALHRWRLPRRRHRRSRIGEDVRPYRGNLREELDRGHDCLRSHRAACAAEGRRQWGREEA